MCCIHVLSHDVCDDIIPQDGRLCRGDQLLGINSQSLLRKSNSEALDTLRKTLATATDSGSKIKLVVARKTGVNKKQPGMATLEETPIEVSGLISIRLTSGVAQFFLLQPNLHASSQPLPQS